MIFLNFAPSLTGGFLSWDDGLNIQENPYFLKGDLAGLWRHPYTGMYIPVTYTVWGFLHQAFDANPMAFRIFNLCLQALNSILVLFLLRRCVGKSQDWRWSYWGALLFAFHPLQADAVSWISGGRDLLAAFFALACALTFFSSRRTLKQILSPLLFFVGLLCKPSIVVLPAVLFLWQFFHEKRKTLREFFQLGVLFLPWLIIAPPVIWLTSSVQKDFIVTSVAWYLRPVVMLDSYGFYLQKFLWPLHLMTNYERLPLEILSHFSMLSTTAPLVFVLLGLMWWPKTRPVWLFPGLCFFILLLPVSGIVPFAFQSKSSVANHYFYLALIPLIAGVIQELQALDLHRRNYGHLIALLLVIFYLPLSQMRSLTWVSEKSFAEALLTENPQSYTGHMDLSKYYFDRGDLDSSFEHAQKAYDLRPQFRSLVNMCVLLFAQRKFDKLVQLDPELDTARFQEKEKTESLLASKLFLVVGLSLQQQGQSQKAQTRICQALRFDPMNLRARQEVKAPCP